ncbi:MAG TPA: protein kinase [Gemmatimonadales bacterium]|nr:protein kinase [Gemmatimonadales bacterium]
MTDGLDHLADALRGRYVFERELGRGGMATVHLAHDLKHDRRVAIKVLHPESAATLGPERFQREIRLAARLHHPHILTVLDSGETESPEPGGARLWFSMPYVDGESLRDRLRRSGPLPLEEAVRIAREAADALQYAHDHGVVHRDMKPENILLTREGNTLVADFGIARPIGDGAAPITTGGMVMGTPGYMSPEQVSGDPVDGRSDIYALGCVLYEMLAGKPPFTGRTAAAIAAQHLTAVPPVLARSGASVPPPVREAVARALAKDPADRFDSAAAFRAALALAQPGRTRRWGWPVIAAAALAAAALLAVTYYSGRRASRALAERPGGTLASGFNRMLTQITFGPGLEEGPAWAPDGKRLAYAGEVDGFRQLVVRSMPGGEERQLSDDPRDHIQPAWAPDGARIAFVRARAEKGKLEPRDLNGWYFEGGDIWALELETGALTRLVDDAFDPAYSPDGARLAFDAGRGGTSRIWVADANGRNPRQVTADSSEAIAHTEPRWSPDGAWIAFRRIEKTWSQIMLVDVASGAMHPVTTGHTTNLNPAWSPDGRYIYFASDRGGGLNLWRVLVSGARGAEAAGTAGATLSAIAPEQLTTGAGNDVQPAVAPAGGGVAFAVRAVNSDVWRLPVAAETGRPTGEPSPLVATTREESRGAWSPDGRRIAFNSDRLGEMNLWVRELAGGGERQLTTGPGGDYQPNWSPDQRSIAFFSARAGNADIWAVRLADGRLTQLTQDPGMDINPFYSPDGGRIAFFSDRSGRGEVWLMSADGTGQRQLSTTGAGGHFLRWAPDGSAIFFRSEIEGQPRILRLSLADGSATRQPDVASGAHMSFSPDHSLILDVRGHKTLWVYPMNGGAPYQVFAFASPDVRIDYPVWSPDGRAVLFDRAAPRGGDLWLLQGVETP